METDRFHCTDFLADNEERHKWKERRRISTQERLQLEYLRERISQKEVQIRIRWLENICETFIDYQNIFDNIST